MLRLILTGSAMTVSDAEYQDLFQAAVETRLEFLFWRSFGNRLQDPEELAYSAALQRKMLLQSMQFESAVKEIRKIFFRENIRFCFFKGSDLAFRVYPFADARVMGDIDVLVHPDDDEKAFDLLTQHGWAAETDYHHSHHHPVMQKKGIVLEQHFSLPGTNAEQMAHLWADPRAFEKKMDSEFLLCAELNCCMLFNHAVRHDWHNAHYLLADIFMLLYRGTTQRLDTALMQNFCSVCDWLYPGIIFEAYREYLPEALLPLASGKFSAEEKDTFRYILSAAPRIDDFDSAGKIYRTSVFSGDFWKKVRISLFEPQRFMERDAEGKMSLRLWRQKNMARLKAFFRVKFCRLPDSADGSFMKRNRDLLKTIREKS